MIDTCHCGHAIDTHFEKEHTCLGARCDCPTYRDSEKPDTYDPPRMRPNHAAHCLCYDCTHGGRVVRRG